MSIDLGAVINQGARLNLEGERLAAAVRGFGTRFALAGEHVEGQLARFELGDDEAPIIEALRTGTSLAELDGRTATWIRAWCRRCCTRSPRAA